MTPTQIEQITKLRNSYEKEVCALFSEYTNKLVKIIEKNDTKN